VPGHYTDSNVYGEKHPVQVEKDIKRQRDWRKVVGEESSRPRRQAIPGGVPVPDSVPYYSSEEEGSGSGSEGEVDDALGSPSSSGDEKVARLSREGGVAFFDFLISKTIVTPKEKGPKEWTYRDVMGLPAGQLEEWRAACQREIETLLKRNVFDIVERPSGCRVIKNRWVFDVKPDGRKRARLVAKGFSQIEGMDFDQIFSPVVRFETVRLILALAALEGWYTSGLDVRNAYLYGELDEEIYMEQPEGFHAKGMEREKHVLRLRRALYGLKQAGLAWWRVLKKSMEELGFVNLDSDAGLFMCLDEASQTFVIAVVYCRRRYIPWTKETCCRHHEAEVHETLGVTRPRRIDRVPPYEDWSCWSKHLSRPSAVLADRPRMLWNAERESRSYSSPCWLCADEISG